MLPIQKYPGSQVWVVDLPNVITVDMFSTLRGLSIWLLPASKNILYFSPRNIRNSFCRSLTVCRKSNVYFAKPAYNISVVSYDQISQVHAPCFYEANIRGDGRVVYVVFKYSCKSVLLERDWDVWRKSTPLAALTQPISQQMSGLEWRQGYHSGIQQAIGEIIKRFL